MSPAFSVSLKDIIDEFKLEQILVPENTEELKITSSDVSRPGLLLAGYQKHFDSGRLQIIGMQEYSYLKHSEPEFRRQSFENLTKEHPPAIVIARELPVFDELDEMCKKYEVPLLRTGDTTSSFMSSVISYLSTELAPRITRHGVLVEVYGEGVFIMGESGVGKSETAIELVQRGHRLVADDAVEIRRINNRSLVGTSPENIRHFIELRGVGMINIRRIFGMSAVRVSGGIDLVVQLELWQQGKSYDRFGFDTEEIDILGVPVPIITIPVKPGRNLAIIIEVAAMNNRQKKLGYNAAKELLDQLGIDM